MKVIIVDDELDRLNNLINDERYGHEKSNEYYKMLLEYIDHVSVEVSSIIK